MALYTINNGKDVCNPAKYVGRPPPTWQQISCIKITLIVGNKFHA
jgi:hypothetical protein